MTKEEAQKVVEMCKGWNQSQRSISYIFEGKRTAEDDILDAKRAALVKAWQVLGEEACK